MKNFVDFSLRISELKNSITHYKNDINMLNDGIREFEEIKKYILLKVKKLDKILQI